MQRAALHLGKVVGKGNFLACATPESFAVVQQTLARR
jgi:hypothetical protein